LRPVCNRHHTLDQQLCRWLLLSLDRLQANELVMTQELIANMLGVRREGVTEAALKLQQAGLIRYARPHHGARPNWVREAQLRVLFSSQKRIRPTAPQTIGELNTELSRCWRSATCALIGLPTHDDCAASDHQARK
jgi:hypothetical protein